jgi:hypothetical protein
VRRRASAVFVLEVDVGERVGRRAVLHSQEVAADTSAFGGNPIEYGNIQVVEPARQIWPRTTGLRHNDLRERDPQGEHFDRLLAMACRSSRHGSFLMQMVSPRGMLMQSRSGPKVTLDFCIDRSSTSGGRGSVSIDRAAT